jgi:hypothetical protein
MTRLGDYNLCITARHDRFQVRAEDVSRLIDFLDNYLYLDGPDRDHSRLVLRSHQESKIWEPFARLDPEEPVQHLRRRHVHVLYSPAVPEEQYRNYGELLQKIDNLMPRDTPFVASLGLASRRLREIIYCPVPNQQHRWIDFMTVHVVQGYHPIWQRIWVEESGRKEWQLQAVKAFILMISCKINGRGEYLSIEEFIEILRLKADFVRFLSVIGNIIGTKDFELTGGTTE